MTETELSKSIRAALESVGVWIERVQSGQHKVNGGWLHCASNGTPDFVVVDPAGFLEIKIPGKKASREQLSWHARARARGIRVAVVCSPKEAVEIVLGWRHGDSLIEELYNGQSTS